MWSVSCVKEWAMAVKNSTIILDNSNGICFRLKYNEFCLRLLCMYSSPFLLNALEALIAIEKHLSEFVHWFIFLFILLSINLHSIINEHLLDRLCMVAFHILWYFVKLACEMKTHDHAAWLFVVRKGVVELSCKNWALFNKQIIWVYNSMYCRWLVTTFFNLFNLSQVLYRKNDSYLPQQTNLNSILITDHESGQL